MKIIINSYRPVGVWQWEVDEECCSICRMPFDACCPECKMPGDDCPPVWGECGHHFHIHCIMKWLQKEQKHCPMCRREWKFRQ
mmetsp:Transcript_57981/g.155269  ORF Transcript_57981/g.155269 Transcript_57981/m.155269 type:complete len:83 (-) Transcript_57981:275-523(-)